MNESECLNVAMHDDQISCDLVVENVSNISPSRSDLSLSPFAGILLMILHDVIYRSSCVKSAHIAAPRFENRAEHNL